MNKSLAGVGDTVSQKQIHILLIEDDEEDILIFRDIIAKLREASFPFYLESASNFEEGLQLLSQRDIDVIFLDFFLPGIDGLEALERLQSETFQVPVVI